MKLEEQRCSADREATALSRTDIDDLLKQIPGWSMSGPELTRGFKFRDFHQAMQFVNSVAAIANEQDHHPDIHISYNRVTLVLTTHKIGALSLNDFIIAARLNLLPVAEPARKAA